MGHEAARLDRGTGPARGLFDLGLQAIEEGLGRDASVGHSRAAAAEHTDAAQRQTEGFGADGREGKVGVLGHGLGDLAQEGEREVEVLGRQPPRQGQ